jgi:hypothetical protein
MTDKSYHSDCRHATQKKAEPLRLSAHVPLLARALGSVAQSDVVEFMALLAEREPAECPA